MATSRTQSSGRNPPRNYGKLVATGAILFFAGGLFLSASIGEVYPPLIFSFGGSIALILAFHVYTEDSGLNTELWIALIVIISIIYRLYVFQLPADGTFIGVDGNSYILDISALIDDGSTAGIRNDFYRNAPLYFILSASVTQVTAIANGLSVSLYPICMGILPPLVAAGIIRTLGMNATAETVGSGLVTLGSTSLFYSVAPIPETLGLLYVILLILVAIGHFERRLNREFLVIAAILFLALMLSHKLPLLFLGMLFIVTHVSISYSKIRVNLAKKVDSFQSIESQVVSLILLIMMVGFLGVLSLVGGHRFIIIMVCLVGIAWTIRNKNTVCNHPSFKSSALLFALISFLLLIILYLFLATGFLTGSIFQVILSLLEATGEPVTASAVESSYISSPELPFLVDFLFTRTRFVHAFALVLLPISVIGSLIIIRQKPERAASHFIVGATVATIGFLGLGLVSSEAISYLRFLMLGEPILMIAVTVVVWKLSYVQQNTTHSQHIVRLKMKAAFPILLVLALIIFQLTSSIATPDSRQDHYFYIDNQELSAKSWGYEHISGKIHTDSYYNSIIYPFLDSERRASFEAFHPYDLALAKLRVRKYRYVAFRSKPVLRTGVGIVKLKWYPEHNLNVRYNRFFDSGKVKYYLNRADTSSVS